MEITRNYYGLPNSIIFNGVNSLDLSLYVSGDKAFNSAEKDYERVSIPGRNGDLFIFRNKYQNVIQSYKAILFNTKYDYNIIARRIREWLLSSNGYCRLEDTYNPDEFRLAQFLGPIDIDTKLLQAGETVIEFNCRPERFLKSGSDILITITNNKRLINPTKFPARPIIYLTGNGKLSFSDISDEVYAIFTVNTKLTSIIIDCENRICYGYSAAGNLELANNDVQIDSSNNDFPELLDSTKFTFTGFSDVSILPRWWTI